MSKAYDEDESENQLVKDVAVSEGQGSGTGELQDEESTARAASTALNTALIFADHERSYLSLKEEHGELTKTCSYQRSHITSLQVTISDLQSKLSERDGELGLAKEKIESYGRKVVNLEEKEKERSERIDRIEIEADSLREEISRLSASNITLNTELAEVRTKSSLTTSSTAPLQYEVTRLRSELDALNAHSSWLEGELSSRSQQISDSKLSHTAELYTVKSELDSVKSERDDLNLDLSSLNQRFSKMQFKLESLQKELLEKEQSHAEATHELNTELNNERAYVTLLKQNSARIEDRYNDAIREIGTMKNLASMGVEEHKTEIENIKKEMQEEFRKTLEDAQKKNEGRVLELQHRVSQVLTEKMKLEEDFMAGVQRRKPAICVDEGPRNNSQGTMIVGLSSSEDGPMSLTDLYEKLADAQDELRQEKLERRRVEMYLERIQLDIEKKAPELRQQKRDYENLLSHRQEIQRRLKEALEEAELAKEEARQKNIDTKEHAQECRELRLENRDLASQVQALLRKMMGGDNDKEEEDIVGFGSVEELQNQNQRLLREHHRLTSSITELEERLETDRVQIQWREAESELQELRNDREKQATLVASIVQQRDLYRALLMKNDSQLISASEEKSDSLVSVKDQFEKYTDAEKKNKELLETISKLKADLATALNAKDGLEERLTRLDSHSADLTSSIEKLQTELSAAHASTARSKAESSFHQQRSERYDDVIESMRSEIARAGDSKTELQRVNGELQSSLSLAKAEATKYEQELLKSESKLRLAETKLKTVLAAETRLATECNTLRSESAKQGALLESMQRMEASLSARTNEEFQRLDEEVKRLTNIVSSERTNHLAEAEMFKNKIANLESNGAALEKKNAETLSEMMKAKEDVVNAKGEYQTLVVKHAGLERELNAAKLRLGDADADISEQDELEKIKSELESVRGDLESANKKCEDFIGIAKEREKSLADLTESSKRYKADMERDLERLKSELSMAQKTSKVKQSALEELSRDLSSSRKDQEKVVTDLKVHIVHLSSELETAQNDRSLYTTQVQTLSKEVLSFKADAIAATDNYERELALHASTRKSLRELREKIETEISQRETAVSQLENIKNEFSVERSEWDECKMKLEDEAKEFTTKLEELRGQNNILHDQMALLTDTVDKYQSAKISDLSENAEDMKSNSNQVVAGSLEETNIIQKQLSEMREVVRFMRSERAMFDSQLESARRTAERERAAAEVTKRSLEEARAELDILQGEDKGIPREGGAEVSLDKFAQMQDKLKHSEEQLTLLRESNQLLREDINRLVEKLSSSQKEAEEIQKAFEPADKKCRELEIDKAALIAEKDSLVREVDAWKERVQSLVSKFHQVDPEEHAKALALVEATKKERDSLQDANNQAEKESASAKALVGRLNKEISKLKSVIDSTKNALEKANTEKEVIAKSSAETANAISKEREELKASKSSLERDLKAAKTEAEGSKKRLDNLTKLLRTNKTRFSELQQKFQQVVKTEKETKATLAKEQEAYSTLLKEHEEQKLVMKEKEDSLVKAQKEGHTLPLPTSVANVESTNNKKSQGEHVSTNIKPSAEVTESTILVAENPSSIPIPASTEESEAKVDSKVDKIQIPVVPTEGFKFAPSTSAMHNSGESKSNEESGNVELNNLKGSKMSDFAKETISSNEDESCMPEGTVDTNPSNDPTKLKSIIPMNVDNESSKGITSSSAIVKTQIVEQESKPPSSTLTCETTDAPQPVSNSKDNKKSANLQTTKESVVNTKVAPIQSSKESALREKLMKRKRALEAEIREKSATPPPAKRVDNSKPDAQIPLVSQEQIPLVSQENADPTETLLSEVPLAVPLQPMKEIPLEKGTTPTIVSSLAQTKTDTNNLISSTINGREEENPASAPIFGSVDSHGSGSNANLSENSGSVDKLSEFGNETTSAGKTLQSKSGFDSMTTKSGEKSAFGGGGAFLNLQPPGTGQTEPLIFGSSSNIQLPTPSKNPIFGSESSFGGFGHKQGNNPFGFDNKVSPVFGLSSTKKRTLPVENIDDPSPKLPRVDEEKVDRDGGNTGEEEGIIDE